MRLGDYMKLNRKSCIEMGYKIIKLFILDDNNIDLVLQKMDCDDETINLFKQMYNEEKNIINK